MWGKSRSKETPVPQTPFVFALDGKTIEPVIEEAPLPRLIRAILHQAIEESAGAVQLVPGERGLRVESLHQETWVETMTIPKNLQSAIAAYLKEMAGLPVWEYRMALQGLILFRDGEQDYDVALSIVPARYGEKITLHIAAAEDAPD